MTIRMERWLIQCVLWCHYYSKLTWGFFTMHFSPALSLYWHYWATCLADFSEDNPENSRLTWQRVGLVITGLKSRWVHFGMCWDYASVKAFLTRDTEVSLNAFSPGLTLRPRPEVTTCSVKTWPSAQQETNNETYDNFEMFTVFRSLHLLCHK